MWVTINFSGGVHFNTNPILKYLFLKQLLLRDLYIYFAATDAIC